MKRLTAAGIEHDLDNAQEGGYWSGERERIDQELDRLYGGAEELDRLRDEVKLLRDESQDRAHGLDLLYDDYLSEEHRADRWERAARCGISRWREMYNDTVSQFVSANVDRADERFRREKVEFVLKAATELIDAYNGRDSPAYSFVELANRISRIQEAEKKWNLVKP